MSSALRRLLERVVTARINPLMVAVLATIALGADVTHAQDCTSGLLGRRTCCVSQTPSEDLRCQGETATMRFVYSNTFSVNRITWEAFHRRTDGTEHFFSGGTGSEAVLNILSTPSASGEYQVRFVEEYLNPETLLWEGACSELQPQIVSRWVRFTHIPGTEIQAQPTSVSTCQGQTFETYFDVTGASSYRWYKRVTGGSPVALVNDGQRIFGTDTPRLSINNVGPADAGAYYCRITNSVSGCGPTQSSDATLTVNTASATYVSGGDRFESVCAGATVSLPLNYTGTNIQYRWFLLQTDGSKRYITSNGSLFGGSTTVSGVDTNTLTLTNIGSTNTPVRYGCTVSANCFSEDRIVCQLTVTTPLRIDTNISDQQMCIGQSTNEFMTFSVFPLSGSGQIYYRWYKFGGSGSPLTNTFPYSGTTGPTLGIDRNATQAQINGPFYCVASQDPTFSNPCGWVISNVAMIWASSTGPTITNPFSNITICRGGRAAFGVDPQGGVTYEWQLLVSNIWTTPVDGTTAAGSIVSGQGTNVLTIDNSQGDVTTVLLRVTNACTSVASLQASLNTRDAATVAAPTIAASNDCVPTLATLSVPSVVGAQYQWLRNGVSLSNDTTYSNVTTRTLTAKRRIEDFNASFACRVDNGCSSATSSSITIPIHVPAVIVGHPASVAACAGASATFTVATSGPGPFTYRWRRNGQDVVVNGTTGWETATFTIHSVDSNRLGSYTCRVRNACGDVFSQAADLTLASTSTTITAHPVETAICAGGSASLSVAATGTGLFYQWQSSTTTTGPWTDVANSGEIAGATTATLMLAEQPGIVGVYFRCRVTACSNQVFSNAARILGVDSVPVAITTHPASRNVCAQSSGPVIMSVTSTGSNPSYRWKRNGADLSDRPGLTGATSPTLTLSAPIAADAGTYTCTVSNACGGVTSSPASLVVNEPVTFTLQPATQSVCPGGSVVLTVAATGGSLTYQWEAQDLSGGAYFNVVNSTRYTGATTPSLTISGVTAPDMRNFRCRVTNLCGAVTSASATFAVLTAPTISAQPSSQSTCLGGTATFSVTASGSNLAYRWTRNGVDLTDGPGVSGSATASLVLSNVTASSAASFFCRVSHQCSTVQSSTVSLSTIGSSVTTQPSPQRVCVGASASFSVVATNPQSISYQWQRNGVNLTNGPTISGATTATLSLSSTSESSAGDYRCVLTPVGCAAINSATATLAVDTPVQITSQPSAQINCVAGSASFTVAATGSGLTYQWQSQSLSGGGFTNVADSASISGSNTPTLTISAIVAADERHYRCNVTTTCGTVSSGSAALNIISPPTISTQPVAQSTCLDGSASFSISAPGTGLTYRWQFNGVDLQDGPGISGTSTPTLALTNVVAASAGNYRCQVKDNCAITNSNQVALSVSGNPIVTTQPNTGFLCAGLPPAFRTISVTVAGTLPVTYQWQRNGVDLVDGAGFSGSSTRTLTIDTASSSRSGLYRCIVTSACGSTTSSEALQSFTDPAQITAHPQSQSFCDLGTVSLSFTSNSSSLTRYQWELRRPGGTFVPIPATPSVLLGASYSSGTGATLTITNANADAAVEYRCSVRNSTCGPAIYTSTVQLTMVPQPTIDTQPQTARTCLTSPATFNISASGAGSLTYRWQWLPTGSATWTDLQTGINAHAGTPRVSASGVDSTVLTLTPMAGAASATQVRCIVNPNTCPTQSQTAMLSICTGDFNCSGSVTIQDVFDYLNAFFNNDPTADFNQSGAISTQDIFDLLNAYFAGCP